MAKAVIQPGNCGYTCTVIAYQDGKQQVTLKIESDCKAIQRMAEELAEVNPFEEISFRRGVPRTLQVGQEYCSHTACPVPVGIIKVVELASGMALPGEVSITLTNDD